MQEYMDKLRAELAELAEAPISIRTVEMAGSVADLLCSLHELYEHGDHIDAKQKKESFTEADAQEWMAHLKNDDPHHPTGPMWSEAECLSVASAAAIDLHDIPGYVFWAAMNMKWSDEWSVARDFGVDQPLYYARQAEAFLRDKDGGGAMRKISAYYRCVVEQ